MKTLFWLALSMMTVACDGSGPDLAELPLSGDAAGPVVASITLQCVGSELSGLRATATDPQGTEDLDDTSPLVRVFLDADASGDPVEVQLRFGDGYFFASDFGLTSASDALMPSAAAICAGGSWPVQVLFPDETGHVTQGEVMATVSKG